ncbi:aldose 1-epimerase [Halobacillus karajensis]|uniref:Uncharacterized protein n=1 Tax=Halobacillus karajensis TaxID=195088 RepID=A0A024P2T1_9BACI|nr:hypothetical protein [Halobacillus karajensis]CDQ19118.1 hypothetical protein BN982_01401 [Halobacillus karajensis]CDQ22808.1 hypothetical protein BN983_01025 [Halobacillus karajensis]CDQ26290.1 hypothetical protein BN981_00505 [Halobacillus karajensis]SEH41325.1 aldose 1-epimerase [Halobacillus karajensis]
MGDKNIPGENRPSDKYLGVCFETQGSPASLHHQGLPSITLAADTIYSQQTVFTFQSGSAA